MPASALHRIAFIGNHVPRRCGIATFTRDLQTAVADQLPRAECMVVSMNDGGGPYAYPPAVRFECDEADPAAFSRAADFLNFANVDVVSLQHEYGIFGGPAGSHVLDLLRQLRAPIHTTLHTVLARPSAEQRSVMQDVVRLSSRLAVMTERGRLLLRDVYGVADDRIDVIPHGIPDVAFADTGVHKSRFGLAGARVLLTFGLLSPSKGIEQVIRALPDVVARHPATRYVVLGSTHPHLVRDQGEAYREGLVRLAAELGVERHVVFHDRFVDMPELTAFLGAADIYLTPYLNEDQITSGTLAYAFGCGKAVLSTPYWHARELLADGRGILVPFRDAGAIAREICGLFDDPDRHQAMRERAYALGREMIWSRVAERYAEAFAKTRQATLVKSRRPPAESRGEIGHASAPRRQLPALRLDHLWRLTDSTGLLQHATHDVPNRAEGYCTDDNARGLALMVHLEELPLDAPKTARAAGSYAAFLGHAFVPATGRFRNFLSYDGRWLDDGGTDDCLGRAVLALGTCIGRSRRPALARWAVDFFQPALRAVSATPSPRAWALAILGIQEYLRRLHGDRLVAGLRDVLIDRLLDLRRATAAADWPWFEDIVAYDNARPCQALISSGRWTGRADALDAGLAMLDWLWRVQCSPSGRFSPIGCRGFLRRGGEPAAFDQQPLEAHGMVAACIEAFHAFGDPRWIERAWLAFDWFRGHNVLGVALCDPRTGGCRDGLLEDRANENQGAESTLAYLAALAEMQLVEHETAAAQPALPHSRRPAHTAATPERFVPRM
jgi:glycosyltransferase involved in cell wall biosynthesis